MVDHVVTVDIFREQVNLTLPLHAVSHTICPPRTGAAHAARHLQRTATAPRAEHLLARHLAPTPRPPRGERRILHSQIGGFFSSRCGFDSLSYTPVAARYFWNRGIRYPPISRLIPLYW